MSQKGCLKLFPYRDIHHHGAWALTVAQRDLSTTFWLQQCSEKAFFKILQGQNADCEHSIVEVVLIILKTSLCNIFSEPQ